MNQSESKLTDPSAAPKDQPLDPAPATSPTVPDKPVSALTPEEQMALFEKDLKENDWGHQPC